MSRYPLIDPMAEFPVAEAERIAAYRTIHLLPDAIGGKATVALAKEDASEPRFVIFRGEDRDARLFLARVAVTFPHLKTDLDKPKRKPGRRRTVWRRHR
ncbi:MAG: hypothetical protein AAFN79_12395 [Pseudomonadota bacterium]